MIKTITVTSALILQSLLLFSQTPPNEFFKGLEVLKTNQLEAKREFQSALEKEPAFFGSYHFLGTISLRDHKLDSAIYYFNKSILLNNSNVNHTKEMAYVRLINTYSYQQDFKSAFNSAREAYKLYPDNPAVAMALKDLCKWSFYIKHAHLNPLYLSQDIQEEYVVSSISQEYLIIRALRVDDEGLQVKGQRLVNQNNANYDVVKCTVSQNNQEFDVKFKLNWDMAKEFGGKPAPIKAVLDNAENPVYERIGALLVGNEKADLKSVIEEFVK